MQPHVKQWFEHRTTQVRDWPRERSARAKARDGVSVSVVLPALNEQETVGAIVREIRGTLMDHMRLVDELIVIDSGSSDHTAARAAAAGARVVAAHSVLPSTPTAGKGDAMWRGLLVSSGDVVVFVDADLECFSADTVAGLLGPLLCDPTVHLVKGMYDRPLRAGEAVFPSGGGRVTELVARPLLNLHWPDLAGFVQPLAGEWAARRRLLEGLAFPAGYGIEIAALVDSLTAVGLDALSQVDLGVRHHRHQDDASLGLMSCQILHAALLRYSRMRPTPLAAAAPLTQFRRLGVGFVDETHSVDLGERPPMSTVAEYRRLQGVEFSPGHRLTRSWRKRSGSSDSGERFWHPVR